MIPECSVVRNALVRYLQRVTGRSADECSLCLGQTHGDVASALRNLDPDGEWPEFPLYYYARGYQRVEDPDRDLPVPVVLVAESIRDRINRDRGKGRNVAPFGDPNSLEEILGGITVALSYPNWDEGEVREYPTIQGLLAETFDRIRAKILITRNQRRAAWFSRALGQIAIASNAYFDGEYRIGEDLLSEAASLLRDGNKAHRRKTAFIVGPEGLPEQV